MGFLYGLLSSAAFGLIPLFSLPLLRAGISVQTALVYRFSIAALVLWPILRLKGERFALRGIDLCKLAGLSLAYMVAVLFFFESFYHLPSGIAATIQFLYPVMVMLIMIAFFHERFYWNVGLAVALALGGVALLSVAGPQAGAATVSFWGVCLGLLSGLSNGLYMIGLQVARIPNLGGLVMTFYIMAFGALIALADGLMRGSLQWLDTGPELLSATLLALVTAVFSNLTLILAIRRIGSTLTSVLGVMEPLTAVAVGILVFGEPFTLPLAAGVALITGAVLLVMLAPRRRQGA
ncbi:MULTISPECIES: DMT family transporter [unclassified Desulfovibrio]|uniref:EamA family transporter n=1 Tax=unclassified Desulfovibrio TaxID=2593640 RepID=UPI0013EC5A1D|nr:MULTISPECIES: DMT family transporter [unclassified Desulfovibrio]